MSKEKILVAPLNWGLGHATRCIPIINALIQEDYLPVLASDGPALELLIKEFPKLPCYTLPSYGIEYSRTGRLKIKLLLSLPRLLLNINRENNFIKQLCAKERIIGIISDNRPGVHLKSIPSVYITHQTQVLSGATTFLSSWMHRQCIYKFDRCWIPDLKNEPNLSGIMSHPSLEKIKCQYIGPLSRWSKKPATEKYGYMVLLSGPEPQRSLLEQHLLTAFGNSNENIIVVRGIMAPEQQKTIEKNRVTYNFLLGEELEKEVLASSIIIARPGYSTVMDLWALEKKAFFIPTPGQPEQEYLAQKLAAEKIAPFCRQEEFDFDQLKKLKDYSGFTSAEAPADLRKIFGFFKSKREFTAHT